MIKKTGNTRMIRNAKNELKTKNDLELGITWCQKQIKTKNT